MFPELLLETIVALFVVILGLYAVTFRRAAANWAVNLDGELIHLRFNEKIYRLEFMVAGVCFIIYGVTALLLLA